MPLLSTFGATSARSFGGIGAAAAGEGLDIDDVFSTFLVTGTGSAYTVNNGLDLSGEGGLVWIKGRSSNGYNHTLYDTERSGTLFSDATNAASDYASEIASYNNNGFTTVSSGAAYNNVNGQEYASWTFRKAPKFFDVVTYTGTQDGDKTISHSLNTTVGMAIIKRYDSAGYDWHVYHTSRGTNKYLLLNGTNAEASGSIVTATSNTSITLSQSNGFNTSGATYVVYLFAHNNSDGEFGPDSDQDIIKCGSYTGGSSNTDQLGDLVNLGFEPQWVMVKNAETTPFGNFGWYMFDAMRGITTTSNDPGKDAYVLANSANSEDGTNDYINLEANGFRPKGGHATNSHGKSYVYMAIRRGPLAEPTSATDVFAIDQENLSAPYYTSNFPVDMGFIRRKDNTSSWYIYDRLRQGRELVINTTAAEGGAGNAQFDYMDGFSAGAFASDVYSWMWKRAPGYFDVVAYSGDGTSSNTINHNLGVVPEMMWFKRRDSSTAGNWLVYHNSYLTTQALFLNSNGALISSQTGNLQSTPTNSSFTVGSYNGVNNSSGKYIAYLFATVAGVSKVGSYTGNGSSQTIDCGFSSGARFVLIKSSTQATEWNVFDTARGIVSGNDPALFLDNTSAEVTNGDFIDPHSSGFTINYVTTLQGCNTSGQSYIFYAIA